MPLPHLRALLLAALALVPVAAHATEPAPTPAKELALDDRLDPAVIYRYDPLTEKLAPVARKDLKADNVYLRPAATGGRHVWSQFDGAGQFRYELGPGSSFPVRLFDPVADQETRRKALEKRAPELARRLATQGARPSLRMDDNGRWRIDQATNSGRIFDLATGERYEWQLGRPVPVVNTGGNSWAWTGSGYRSTTVGYGGAEPVIDDFCPPACAVRSCRP